MLLNLQQLAQVLQHSPVGHTIDYHRSIPSTMLIAQKLAEQPHTRSGVVIVAEEQTAGRGRLQRRWETPLGQALLVSIIMKPTQFAGWQGLAPMLLSMAAGVATARAIEAFSPSFTGHVGLKWPNDVLLSHDSDYNMQKVGKVAGILVEGAFHQGELLYAILGIGINVNQTHADLPPAQPGAPAPTSLRLFADQEFDRTALFIALCHALGELVHPDQPAQALRTEWRSRLWTLGQMVTVRTTGTAGESFSGRAVDVTPEGSLVVEDETGARRSFTAGDVSIRTG
ncbi:MAG: biotin--[acetyl-CoA-carboxylase] ligase [Chloroflexi bacterium]|nr:biotin--[acetyl-CoA-carboxylase] ligase [Chloroflexota bacterium]